MKKNRIFSFIIIGLIYIIATIIGVLIYEKLSYAFWINLLIADVVATIIVFIFSCILKNASVYDPYWSVQPIVIIVFFICKHGFNITNILFLIVVSIWGLRLTLNWIYTFKNLTFQDWRYTMLKEKIKKFYPIINFIGIHMVPTLIVYGCIIPVIFVIVEVGKINIITLLSLLVSICACTIQGIADIQMHTFRKNKRTGFIRDGLWKYSRHPNYFGEIMMWWGIGIASVSCLPNKWFLLAGALCNTLLFLFVSIPMADNKNKKRGDFEKLKSETRMLLPIKK